MRTCVVRLPLRNSLLVGTRAAAIVFLLHASSCSIPKVELSSYIRSFESARTTSEDLMLEARAEAESWAADPRNTADIPARLDRLEKTRESIEARLAALEVMGRYNGILEALATGTDADALRGEITRLQDGLRAFNVKFLTRFAGAVPQYGELIVAAIQLADDLIRRAKFHEAVKAGEPAVMAIVEILRKDAEQLHEVFKSVADRDQNQLSGRVVKLQQPFKQVIEAYGAGLLVSTDPDVKSVFGRYVTARAAVGETDPVPAFKPPEGAAPPPALGDRERLQLLAALRTIVDDSEDAATRSRALTESVQAHDKMVKEYIVTLQQVQVAMKQLRQAIDGQRIEAIMDITGQVLRLRQAVLELREKKRS